MGFNSLLLLLDMFVFLIFEKDILSNLCRATLGGYIHFGCSRKVSLLRGYFQWSMSLRGGDIFAGRERLPLIRGAALGG